MYIDKTITWKVCQYLGESLTLYTAYEKSVFQITLILLKAKGLILSLEINCPFLYNF